jgi:hypothetical protein
LAFSIGLPSQKRSIAKRIDLMQPDTESGYEHGKNQQQEARRDPDKKRPS